MRYILSFLIGFQTTVFCYSQNAFQQPVIKDSIVVKSTSIKCQYFTGTCWNFATTSFLESEILRQRGKVFDLSEKYIVYYNYMDKADKYVRHHGFMNLQQGSQAHDAIEILRKSGIVPESAYPMEKGPDHTSIHGGLLDSLTFMLKKVLGNGYSPISQNYHTECEALLNKTLGVPPKEFVYEGKTYTPQSFYNANINIDLNDYVEITSIGNQPYYQKVVLDVPDNWRHATYLNLPLEDFVQVVNNSLKMDYSLIWDGDVTDGGYDVSRIVYRVDLEKQVNNRDSILNAVASLRQPHFDTWETTDDHLMHLIGVGKDAEGVLYYKFKDSAGENHPYVYISEPYFRLRTIAIMVHKDVIPKSITKKLNALAKK